MNFYYYYYVPYIPEKSSGIPTHMRDGINE